MQTRATNENSQRVFRNSLQPVGQFRRITRAMPDGNRLDFSVGFVDDDVNRVRPVMHPRLASFASGFGKPKRLGRNCRNHRLPKFKCGFRIVNDPKVYFLYLASVSSRSCSQGMPRPGFFSASSARRSSSAICSGVSVSAKSSSAKSRICSKAKRRSSSGSLQNYSTTWVALMAAIYSFDLTVQAGVSPSRITHHASRHP